MKWLTLTGMFKINLVVFSKFIFYNDSIYSYILKQNKIKLPYLSLSKRKILLKLFAYITVELPEDRTISILFLQYIYSLLKL